MQRRSIGIRSQAGQKVNNAPKTIDAALTAGARLFSTALSFFAPPRCRNCRAPLFGRQNPYLCPSCAAGMHWIGDGACRGCGFPAGPHARHGANCHRCRGNRLALTGATSVVRYRAAARSLVLALKFAGETEIARVMAALMAKRLAEADFFAAVDFIVPVTLHPSRRRQRGFDQAVLLAVLVGKAAEIPVQPDALKRSRRTRPQSSLRREARLNNMIGAFTASSTIEGKRILLVDDVMTTGATMAECARTCRAAGAARVYALTFAR